MDLRLKQSGFEVNMFETKVLVNWRDNRTHRHIFRAGGRISPPPVIISSFTLLQLVMPLLLSSPSNAPIMPPHFGINLPMKSQKPHIFIQFVLCVVTQAPCHHYLQGNLHPLIPGNYTISHSPTTYHIPLSIILFCIPLSSIIMPPPFWHFAPFLHSSCHDVLETSLFLHSFLHSLVR